MNDTTTQLLTKIYQNARMGCDSISYVSDKAKDSEMRDSLLKQHGQYNDVSRDAMNMLNKSGEPAKENNPVSKACLWSAVQMNTLTSKSADHIAEMMIQGSMMGVIDLSRNLKKYSDAEENALKLGEKLIKVEEDNIQRMKGYLG